MNYYKKYEAVIGLEIHAQLLTKTKAYSSDENVYGAAPNTKTSVISLAHPGTLPKSNSQVIEYAVKLGVAVGGKIRERNEYARKNYFYADLPKGYQITQDTTPICNGGNICADTHICSEIDSSGNANWVTCPEGADYLCASTLAGCYELGCDETGLPDCAGDGDCCPASWLSDGFCDDSDQFWGCDLTCYDGEVEDDCFGRSSEPPADPSIYKPIFSMDIETREECDFVWGPNADCSGECGGDLVLDECLDCGGDGPEENFDCEENCLIDVDCLGVCGGLSVSDDCGSCWSPYCYDMSTHIPDYMSTEATCNDVGLMWIGPGNPTWAVHLFKTGLG